MRFKSLGTCLAIMTVAAGLSGLAHADVQAPLDLKYELYAGGLHALDFEARLALTKSAYRVDFKAESAGMLARFLSFVMEARTEGARGSQGPRPLHYENTTHWQDNPLRRVEIKYGPDGAVAAVAEPPPEEDEREPIPQSQIDRTLDPLSGLVAILQGLETAGDCTARVPVYDGRRRYDMVARPAGEREFTANATAPFGGRAEECRVSLEKPRGFWTDERRRRSLFDGVTVFLAPVVAGGPKLPVRLEAENSFAPVRVHLVAVQQTGRLLFGLCSEEMAAC